MERLYTDGMFRLMVFGVGNLITPFTASIRAIFHLIPAIGPFFAPGERTLANGRWQTAHIFSGKSDLRR